MNFFGVWNSDGLRLWSFLVQWILDHALFKELAKADVSLSLDHVGQNGFYSIEHYFHEILVLWDNMYNWKKRRLSSSNTFGTLSIMPSYNRFLHTRTSQHL